MDSNILVTISGFILVGLAIASVLTTYILYRISGNLNGRSSRALKERKYVAAILTAASLLCASIGVYRILSILGGAPDGNIQPYPTITVTVIAILIGLPGILWVIGYFTDWFSGG